MAVEELQRVIRSRHWETIVKWKELYPPEACLEKWDVAGTWMITCPYLEKLYGKGKRRHGTLSIGFTQRGRRRMMWAEFDLMILRGILRFVNPAPDNAGRFYPAPRPPDLHVPDPWGLLSELDIEEQEKAMQPHLYNDTEPSESIFQDGDDENTESKGVGRVMEVDCEDEGLKFSDDEALEGDEMVDSALVTDMRSTYYDSSEDPSFENLDNNAAFTVPPQLLLYPVDDESNGDLSTEIERECSHDNTQNDDFVNSVSATEDKFGGCADVVFNARAEDNEHYFSAFAQPSPRERRWYYRWRGENTVTGEKQKDSDINLCGITFDHGPDGMHLYGTFFSELTGRVIFDGWKTGPLEKHIDIDEQWKEYG